MIRSSIAPPIDDARIRLEFVSATDDDTSAGVVPGEGRVVGVDCLIVGSSVLLFGSGSINKLVVVTLLTRGRTNSEEVPVRVISDGAREGSEDKVRKNLKKKLQ